MSKAKVLFVCKNNVGRSQWAMEDYNQTRPGQADSAGTVVDEPGGLVADWQGGPEMIMEAIREDGIDISRNQRTQLTEQMLGSYVMVFVMAQKETWPDFLEIKEHIRGWDIADPVNMPYAAIKKIREDVRQRVQDLVHQTTKLSA